MSFIRRLKTPVDQAGCVALLLAVCLLAGCSQAANQTPGSEGVPAGTGSVGLFVEPDDGVAPIVAFVRGAHQSLDVAMYLLSDREVISALEASRRQGVRVRVMLEEHPYGTGPGNQGVAKRLAAAGIAVRWAPPTVRLSHDKYAVADGSVALLGTANWTRSAFRRNREYLVEDRAAVDVRQLQTLFDDDWAGQGFAVNDESLVVSPLNSRARLRSLIVAARQRIDLEAEEMQDPEIESALAGAAARGVTVRVVLPRATGRADPNAAGKDTLIAAHVQVHELADPYVHAKDVVVDGREAFVGSENLSTASLDENREVGLLISDRAAVSTLEDVFSRDWRIGRP